uniref:Uncharacterized protein n=1 Tax=Arundo donax TaxID=35708 RepID=A0A0A8YE13_ARUDO
MSLGMILVVSHAYAFTHMDECTYAWHIT